MKALVLKNVNDIDICDVPKPEAGKGELLVKVMAAGICGSDIPRAYKDGAHNMPLIIGHEFSGVVESTGDGVGQDWAGKHVGVFPLIPCKTCSQCKKKRYEMCKHYDYLGSRCNGGFAEYVAVPEWNLIELPNEVKFEEAAMLEPMAVAVHAMRRAAVMSEETVMVCGTGTIGMLLTMFLMEKGVKDIYVVCNKDSQKNTLISMGISEENICDSRKESPEDYVSRMTDGEGVDVFFECVGSNDTVVTALKVVTPKGKICYVGNPHSDMLIDKNTYWQILRKQLAIVGTWNSSYYGGGFLGENEEASTIDLDEDDWQYVIKRLSKESINPGRFITHKYALEDIEQGFEIMRDKTEDYVKIMAIYQDQR